MCSPPLPGLPVSLARCSSVHLITSKNTKLQLTSLSLTERHFVLLAARAVAFVSFLVKHLNVDVDVDVDAGSMANLSSVDGSKRSRKSAHAATELRFRKDKTRSAHVTVWGNFRVDGRQANDFFDKNLSLSAISTDYFLTVFIFLLINCY